MLCDDRTRQQTTAQVQSKVYCQYRIERILSYLTNISNQHQVEVIDDLAACLSNKCACCNAERIARLARIPQQQGGINNV